MTDSLCASAEYPEQGIRLFFWLHRHPGDKPQATGEIIKYIIVDLMLIAKMHIRKVEKFKKRVKTLEAGKGKQKSIVSAR